MVRSVVQRFLCRRYAPLLAPYNEGGLNAAARARVAVHLEDCPNCRAEFAELKAVSALLRSHVPAPAAPAADFWSKLEARIQVEAPRPHLAPLVPDGPLLPSPEPRFVWNVFGRSFASAGAIVGVAVACTLVVLQKGLEVFPLSSPTPTASASTAPETVTIALIPKESAISNQESGAGRPQGASLPEISLRRDALRASAAESRIPNSVSRLKPTLSVRTAETSPVAQTSRPIRLEIRQGKSFNGTSPRYADNAAKRRDVVALGYIEPREPQDAPPAKAFDFDVNLTESPKSVYYGMVESDAAGAALVATARVPLRQVAWVPDAELEARAVPASASAADSLMQERQRQTLFSYTR